MRNLTLVSSSNYHGTGYLEHCEAVIRELFSSCRTILFVPYALHALDDYAETARNRFRELDLDLVSVHSSTDPVSSVREAEGLFIGGGNTFRLLKRLEEEALLGPIRQRVNAGVPYLGTSAGSIVACPSIKTTNDMPIVKPKSFAALGLVDFQINAHYLDPDPASVHQGETRELRIQQFHEENTLPVIGLREGSWLRVQGDAVRLQGQVGARYFTQGVQPIEVKTGSFMNEFLTKGSPPPQDS